MFAAMRGFQNKEELMVGWLHDVCSATDFGKEVGLAVLASAVGSLLIHYADFALRQEHRMTIKCFSNCWIGCLSCCNRPHGT